MPRRAANKNEENTSSDWKAGRFSEANPLKADVLIAGGGLVGGTLACALAMGGFRVAVVDSQDPKEGLDAEFDGRASAIALSSKRVLDGLGLWAHIEPDAGPIGDIRVSDGDSLFFLHYDHKDIGDEAFGYMVENRTLRRALAERFTSLDNIALLAPARVKDLDRTPGQVRATLEDGRCIEAGLIVGAEGRNSPTRDAAGIKLTRWSYHQTGIVCTVAHEHSHENIAHEHFLPAGPFAILPLPGNRASIVWTEKSDLAPAIMALDNDGFLSELKTRFGDFLGDIEVVGPRWAYPLSLQYAGRATDQRLVLVGDASHGMHPIAGQGLNMGLRDVAALAEVMTDARRLGLDPGDGVILDQYERWRRFDNTLMLAMTDFLNRLFSNDIEPVRLARDLGMAAVNKIPPLKKVFMRHAMGLAGDLPRLMRGETL
ncbi:MAG: UbiH/UbiF/VisC/COQ6 family ubiquinone biosynthesis hydroxylase [Rhodospirillaceae bacterium]|jgi:2-octaprenyl-6-methoxyphenol hydroxylase|nr:UbiH/UbiF/VisC/COQ6 family ubiquinone biosynthesis hydroxylase [Rhodospirillaceae bacterium]MBT4219782.1 UbiH/UbiF/VisC/COQ6 family ubiquinone biosynthesis hydroxylase [Rhodospirillaceae bacterium]MBT4464333.1 UbiH/UbiF/VisC/COQ6 family ubiquinone biosynthesis hydroxylase [Rhodospirillaceae bacterium]MBT5014649.1 UbiH/UbiF/VisC/COQ6 family ubiquinone biosynthesis hydroxylase [Rhodospirillaceae bacterium]MBT5309392.1 UbiH/UbiF/VisC/COQ6 family ubiquinone biosynthesis hydroxylase [Rhodospirill